MVRSGQIAAGVMTAMLLVAGVSASGDVTYGKGVKLGEATAISALYANPAKFVGKTIRIDGVVSSVCADMGCWVALADSENGDQSVRFKVDDREGIVFPISARGKKASAEGVFQKLTANDKESLEAAKEDKASHPAAAAFGMKYQVKATGAVVK